MMASIIQIILFTSLILSALAGAGVGQENVGGNTENTGSAQECGSQEEVLNGGKCYLFVKEPKTYEDAKKACPNQKIALPVSKEENKFLVKELAKKNEKRIWIGAYKNGQKWDLKYANFSAGTEQESKKCMFMNETGGWNEQACTESVSFFCEKPKPSSQNAGGNTGNAGSANQQNAQENEDSQTNNVDSEKPTKKQDSAAAIAQFSVKGTILLAVASSLMIALGLN